MTELSDQENEKTKFEKAQQLFLDALDVVPPSGRQAWVLHQSNASNDVVEIVLAMLRADAAIEERLQDFGNNETIPLPMATPSGSAVNWGARTFPQINNYEILSEIARGGMGVVYKAKQLRPNRLVAIKMIRAGSFASRSEIERFFTEADAAAQLDDESVVPVYEFGEVNGEPFIAMKYIDGDNLEAILSRDVVSIPKSLNLRWSPLRLQTERPVVDGPDGQKIKRANRSLADFIAPKSGPGAKPDYIGLFAVTSGLSIEKKVAQFEAAGDDYNAIMLKALADRLAEAFAEFLHQRVRTDLWGYAADETLGIDALIAEQYRGIRPAPGYPACPDHSVKREMFEVLDAADIGMALTESLAMTPAASVSGFFLAHPESVYFNVGRIGDDQLLDWAARQEMAADDARRLLAPALG